jgi:hypothetical protein
MEQVCPYLFCAVWLGVVGFVVINLAVRGFRGAGLGTRVVREEVAFRTESSGMVKTDLSVVTTRHRTAPIGIALVQRGPLSIAGTGVNLTREQALVIAGWLREAARR